MALRFQLLPTTYVLLEKKRKIIISDQCILTTYLDYELPTIKLSPKLRQNRFKVQSNETQNSQCKFAICLALSIRYLNSFSMYILMNSEITK